MSGPILSPDPRRPVFICGGDDRPGTRSDCPEPVHDWPLPDGYNEAHDVARSRISRGWTQRRCLECGILGWVQGRKVNPETDVLVSYE